MVARVLWIGEAHPPLDRRGEDNVRGADVQQEFDLGNAIDLLVRHGHNARDIFERWTVPQLWFYVERAVDFERERATRERKLIGIIAQQITLGTASALGGKDAAAKFREGQTKLMASEEMSDGRHVEGAS